MKKENATLCTPKYLNTGSYIIRIDSILSIDIKECKVFTSEITEGNKAVFYNLSEDKVKKLIDILKNDYGGIINI